MELKVKDRVAIISGNGDELAQGTIYNINDLREQKYAVSVEGYNDYLFLNENQVIKIEN